ncbi:MAG: dephospho-CoA kinase [Lutibacter sp.]|nr:dephospho-CoA kinase [bacterium AH-315-A23]PHQ55989.1 MAG: dephospho-CoA kinase [Lutibacter sp.]PHS52566.1 MAG: dephospho-CoA kinase [Lutibacter sp.]
MKIIGLTGGIGSGKSTVLQLFQELGATIYIADIEAKKLMNNSKELVKEIKLLFGEQVYKNDELNTSLISSIVFSNNVKLKALNKIVHPKVKAHFKEFIENTKAEIVIYEAAILFESGSNKMCDFIITVTANFEEKVKRIRTRDGASKQQILERMKHQLEDDYKIKNANFVIRNNTIKDTKLQVSTINNLILKLDNY